jgi:hypothetical protein
MQRKSSQYILASGQPPELDYACVPRPYYVYEVRWLGIGMHMHMYLLRCDPDPWTPLFQLFSFQKLSKLKDRICFEKQYRTLTLLASLSH